MTMEYPLHQALPCRQPSPLSVISSNLALAPSARKSLNFSLGAP